MAYGSSRLQAPTRRRRSVARWRTESSCHFRSSRRFPASGSRADRVWYRRTFQVPDDWNGRRVLLHFGAVDWESVVYINHVEVGRHRGGYDPFTLDITDALTADEEHELVIDVFDPTSDGDQPRGKQVNNPKGIWYTPSTGIWQSVWMEPVSPSASAA